MGRILTILMGCFGIVAAVHASTFKGIQISESNVAAMKGIANALFSYSERQPSNVQNNTKNEPSEPVINVFVLKENPPFEFLEKGEVVGFEVDFLREVMRSAGLKFNIVLGDLLSLENLMKTGQIDLAIGSFSKSQKLDSLVQYSESYLSNYSAVVWPKNVKGDSVQFAGKKIGVLAQSPQQQYILKANIAGATVSIYASLNDMTSDLFPKNEESKAALDFVLMGEHEARDLVARKPELQYLRWEEFGEIVMLFRKYFDLAGKLDEAIKASLRSMTFSEMKKRWEID